MSHLHKPVYGHVFVYFVNHLRVAGERRTESHAHGQHSRIGAAADCDGLGVAAHFLVVNLQQTFDEGTVGVHVQRLLDVSLFYFEAVYAVFLPVSDGGQWIYCPCCIFYG